VALLPTVKPSRVDRDDANPHLRADILWFVLGIVWIVAFTLAPFELAFPPNGLWSQLEQTVRLEGSYEPIKIAGHLVSFWTFGIIVGTVCCTGRRWSTLLIPCAIGCTLLEAAQLFQVGRHARITDLGMNFGALGAGIWFSTQTRIGRACTRQLRTDFWPFAQLVIVVGACALWFMVGLQPAFGGLRLNWDRAFPLTVGNEVGAARPWFGTVRYIAIYARALSLAEVKKLDGSVIDLNGSGMQRADDLLAAYEFRREPTSELPPKGESSGGDLDLLVPPNAKWSAEQGLSPARYPVIRSRGTATRITDKISATGAFTLECWCKPDNLNQVGPARLVSISNGPAARNFTLGQAGPDVVFRVRNHLNSPNGTVHELQAPNVLTAEVQGLVATYDHGVSTIYRDGKTCSSVDLREPVFYAGVDTKPLGRGALAALVVITMALPAVFVFRAFFRMPVAGIVTAVFTAVVGLLPYIATCSILGGPWRFGFVGLFLAALALIYPAGLAVISRRRNPRCDAS
jgi:VanZ family protein